MAETSNLKLPYIEAAQAQKHVTHNESIRALDALVQLMVLDKDLAAPPPEPADGDRYIVAPLPTGAWSSQAAKIAAWQDGAWAFYVPREGFSVWVADEDKLYVWTGSAWAVLSGSAIDLQNLILLGVNATADATNKLAVASPAALFTHNGGGVQVKVNKNAAADSASLLFQTNSSGRAELGTTGDDAFHLKVSADGSAFKEALTVDSSTGILSLPQGRLDRSGPATVLSSHNPAALDADAAPFQWTVQDFEGVNLPGSPRANVAWRFGYNIAPNGTRVSTSEPALADEYEIFYTQGGVQVMERHIAFIDTAGNLRRPLSFLIPRDGGAGSTASIASDVLSLHTLTGTQKIKFDLTANNVVDLLAGMTLRGWTNNDPIQQQRNAAGTGFINLPYINASNYCQFEAPMFVSGQIGSLGALLFMTTNNAANSNKLLDLYFSNIVTGAVASKIEGAASSGHELICYNTHTTSGNAHATLLARTLPGGGDANIVFDAIGGTSWAVGADRSDSSKFKVCRHVGLGTNDSLVIDANVVEAKLPAKFPSYTVAGAPSASVVGPGATIFVSDETGGAVPAFSDGTNWRRVTDRAVVS